MKNEARSEPEKLQIALVLEGEDAARFRRYKETQKLKANAAAGYKLMFERLDQVERADAAAA